MPSRFEQHDQRWWRRQAQRRRRTSVRKWDEWVGVLLVALVALFLYGLVIYAIHDSAIGQ